MAYSLLTSISLAFWFTTSTGSVKIVPPPSGAPAAPALATSRTIFSGGRATVGGGIDVGSGSVVWRPWEATCSVHLGAVPVAVLVAAGRVGVPVSRLRHARQSMADRSR